MVTLAAGEEHKTLASVATIWDAALGAGIDRDALVIGFGGGVVGDLAGFAASALLRGVRSLIVPTTLLSMVDASVGGKTGFDHPTGKNLLGSFNQPRGVVVDLAHLETLPPRERAAGLAEIVKIALATDAGLLDDLERDASRIAAGDPARSRRSCGGRSRRRSGSSATTSASKVGARCSTSGTRWDMPSRPTASTASTCTGKL